LASQPYTRADRRNLPKVGRTALVGRFVVLFLAIAALLGGLLGLGYYIERKDLLARTASDERQALVLYQTILLSNFHQVLSDLQWLAEQNELLAWLDGEEGALARIGAEYLSLARSRGIYDQVRFLDDTGQEVVRANYYDGAPALVAGPELQNKAKRYYFRDTWRLAPGQVFVSPLDLNIEGDRIETPFKPMIRFGTPVADRQERKRGVLVLNYLGARMIDSLRRADAGSPGELMLLNSGGYWLVGPRSEDEWGFMFEAGKERTFANRYTGAWETIRDAASGQFYAGEDLFSFATVSPLTPGLISSSGAAGAQESSAETVGAEAYTWKIVSRVPGDVLLAPANRLRDRLYGLATVLALLVAVASWFVARAWTRTRLYRQEIERMARIDALTGLPNRPFFLDRLEHALRQAARYQHKMGLLLVDLDGFKAVNDTLGHQTGDRVLQEAAARLSASVRKSDTVGRMGGDEFTVCLSRLGHVGDAAIVAEKILDRLREPAPWRPEAPLIGASIGISYYPEDGTDAPALLHRADLAMYEAKTRGKNAYRFHSPPGDAEAAPVAG